MKKILIIFMLLAVMVSNTAVIYCEALPDGSYVGLQPMSSLSPGDKEMKWFHECNLEIKGGKITLSKNPVTVKRGAKMYSASDGGFYTYKGSIFQKDQKFYLKLVLVDSDYAAVRVIPDPEKVKKYPDYKSWTDEKQDKVGIWVTPTPAPFEKEIKFSKNGCEFDGVKYVKAGGKDLMEPVK